MADSNIVEMPSAPISEQASSRRATGRPDKSAMRVELIDKASEVITDTPLLINMVSKRVRQLNNGRSPLIKIVERMGAADIALTEIIEGKIKLVGEQINK